MRKCLLFLLLCPMLILSACSVEINDKKEEGSQALFPLDHKEEPITNKEMPLPLVPKENISENTSGDIKVNRSIKSDKLGIKVSYYSANIEVLGKNTEVLAKEDNNKIFFYNSFDKDYKNGQFLEVFSKDSQIDFKKTIEDKFLKNISLDKCFVTIVEDNSKYQKALIDYPDSPCSDGSPAWTCNACPSGYSKSNGISYFIYYKDHPNTYFFFSIGQDTLVDISAWGTEDKDRRLSLEWFNNVEFIK